MLWITLLTENPQARDSFIDFLKRREEELLSTLARVLLTDHMQAIAVAGKLEGTKNVRLVFELYEKEAIKQDERSRKQK